MNMNKFTVEETNLLSIYRAESKQETMKNISAALSFMAEDMQGLAKRLMKKLEDLRRQIGRASCRERV